MGREGNAGGGAGVRGVDVWVGLGWGSLAVLVGVKIL